VHQQPVLISAIISAAIVTCLGAILLAPGADGSATLIALALAWEGAVALVGFLVTHGIWARRMLAATLTSGIIALAVTGQTPWWWAALALGAMGLYVVIGPPLDRWTRRLVPPTPLPYQVIVLPLALLAVPYVAGLLRVEIVAAAVWTAVAAATAWAFSRAWVAGLWSARILVPASGIFASLTAPSIWQTVVVIAVIAVTTWFAWTKPALLVVSPLEPIRGQVKPVFAALAPEEVRRAAGVDRDGRRI
jgi:hypothetical protein